MMSRWLVFLLLLISLAGAAQEIPLEGCRQLPIVKAKVGKRQFQFLLDTGAAATLLNDKSFSSLESTEIMMDSWNGQTAARAREVVLQDFSIGDQSLSNLKLLAVDLTPLERSCQRRIDGVLGADLIVKFGLTIDLKNRVATLDANSRTTEARLDQLNQHQKACEDAFNRSDEKTFEQCLDPDIVLLTSKGDFHGRKAVMKHFRESYFGKNPPVLISITPRGRHVMGTVIWIEYDMSVTVGPQVMQAHGTALYQKAGQRWVMSNMSYAPKESVPLVGTDRR
ncbi:MAG TPA: aspartyl protease family protein [Candidatus Angelobacter sp.]